MKNRVVSILIFIVFALLAYLVFDNYTQTHTRIDGTTANKSEVWLVAIGIGIIAVCIKELFGDSNGGGGDFDCTGGSGAIM